jgi:hypothetical protein
VPARVRLLIFPKNLLPCLTLPPEHTLKIADFGLDIDGKHAVPTFHRSRCEPSCFFADQ